MSIFSLFSKIATSYDLANRVLSLGMDLRWRRFLVRETHNFKPDARRILDLACGTGDVVKEAKKVFPQGVIYIGLDPCGEMLNVARKRLDREIPLVRGLAENLPFKRGIFDVVFISFGLRNFSNRKQALGEIYRILKPGGVVSVLEFTKPVGRNPFSTLGWFYTKYAVPLLGGVISGDFEAYRYLARSIEHFLTPEEVAKEFSQVGFKPLKVELFKPAPTALFIFRKPSLSLQ
jgi:demethylmenaquinone methyltransferase/2-methoxy-6-polyprenyl-1,4-benzoquinol methylase